MIVFWVCADYGGGCLSRTHQQKQLLLFDKMMWLSASIISLKECKYEMLHRASCVNAIMILMAQDVADKIPCVYFWQRRLLVTRLALQQPLIHLWHILTTSTSNVQSIIKSPHRVSKQCAHVCADVQLDVTYNWRMFLYWEKLGAPIICLYIAFTLFSFDILCEGVRERRGPSTRH